jgi:hypothetical protein
VNTALREVAYVADVIAFPVLIHVLERLSFSADLSSHLKRFENRAAIVAPSAEIVYLPISWRFPELLDEPNDIIRVYVVSYLLTFVPKDFVDATFDVAPDQIAQKSVELHAAVIGPGQAAPPETASLHAEIAAIFLY